MCTQNAMRTAQNVLKFKYKKTSFLRILIFIKYYIFIIINNII